MRQAIAFGWSLALSTFVPGFADTTRVSVDSAGNQADGDNFFATVSANGRFVAFSSAASNLVPGDTNGQFDVFVRDRRIGKTVRVSVGSGGAQANGLSARAWISGNARFVAFRSSATKLVPGDTNDAADVFVRDRLLGTTERVSVGVGGVEGNGHSVEARISSDGRFVTFRSFATNLVPGDTNGWIDEFLHDRSTGKTERVSVSSSGAQSNGGSYGSIASADGRFVAFYSKASNLAAGDTNGVGDVFIRDRRNGTTVLACIRPAGKSANAMNELHSISADGRFVTFGSPATNLVAGGTNGQSHVHLLDRDSGTIELVSVASDGSQGNAASHSSAVSRDGRYVVFSSSASNWSLATSTPRRMPSSGIAISGSPRA